MKRKIGTQLEDEIFVELKTRAAQEHRPISDLLHEAISHYLHSDLRLIERQRAMDRVIHPPTQTNPSTLRKIMEEDFYDQ